MNKPQGSLWFMYFFLSIFFIVGSCCLLYAPVKIAKTLLFMRHATTTTGTVVDFHASRGSRSTTYAPEVIFTTPDGRQVRFRSQISSGSPDYSVGQEVPVSYDPMNPGRAEIRAFIPLWMPAIILSAIGLAFTAFSGGMMFMIKRGSDAVRRKEARLKQGLKEWETEDAWRSGTVRSLTRQEAWFFWLFALVWNAIGQPAGWLCVREFFRGNRLAIIGLLFPLVGFWLLGLAVRKSLQMRRFGELILKLDPFPGSLGGEVGGTVELPVAFDPAHSFLVSLTCEAATNDKSESHHQTIWQETGKAAAVPASAGTRVAFRFAVPASLPATGDGQPMSHQWFVRLTAKLSGIDLNHRFVVPVVATEAPLRSNLAVSTAPELAAVGNAAATSVRR